MKRRNMFKNVTSKMKRKKEIKKKETHIARGDAF